VFESRAFIGLSIFLVALDLCWMSSAAARPLAVGLVGAAAWVASWWARQEHPNPARGRFPGVRCEEMRSEGAVSHIKAKMLGFHRKGLVDVGDWHCLTMCPPINLAQIYSSVRYYMNMIRPHVVVKIWDAREKEAQEGLSKADFFKKYGFVLISRETAMSAQDWDASAPDPLGIQHVTGHGMKKNVETPLSRKYTQEVEQVIRELLPDAKEIELDPLLARRGPGTKNPGYNFAPHQDYGFTADDWPLAGPEFRQRFGREDCHGLVVVNFWRPVRPMQGPVRKTPLAVCDPASVKMQDIVPVNVRRDSLGYTKMLDLAFDEDQRWYYYPDMTVDEVLIFKSFQHFKSQAGPELHTCFHTAFEHPAAPPGAEERQSCEYRARIWF